jgi:signal transduction histidine kinase
MNRSLAAQISPCAGRPPSVGDPAFLQATALVLLLAVENAKLSATSEESLRQLADARARIIDASDVGRRRLERDLHDGAQQRLTAIQVKLGLAQEATRDPDLARQLESISQEAARAIDDLRTLARGIYPAVLRDYGLGDALRAVAREAPIPVRVVDDGVGRCPEPVEGAIYFCSLEAIQNASKHAGAHAHVTVFLTRDKSGVRFEVADDGVGMELPQHSDGIGMTSMRDRIGAVAGHLEIRSSPGQGTTVRGAVPDAGDRICGTSPNRRSLQSTSQRSSPEASRRRAAAPGQSSRPLVASLRERAS